MSDDTDKKPVAAIVLPAKEGFSERSVGAIGLLVRRLALAMGGFDNVVVGAASDVPTFPGLAYVGLRGARFAGRPLNWLYARLVARALRRLRPAVVEVHNRPPLAAYLARRLANTPVILFLHNDPQQAHGAETAAQRKRLLQRLAAVVVVSNWLRDRFLEGITGLVNPPVLISNCIDPAEMPKPLHHAEREKLILFVGRLVHNKGADAFVAATGGALRQLPEWRAEAIGADSLSSDSGETEYLRGLHDAARDTAIVFAGYRSHADTMATMARAAIVVMPSRWEEPFGLVALEALASGAALICSSRGALPQVAGDAAVYVDPEDVAALEQAIVDVANDPERRRVLSELGRARAQGFSAASAARALERLRRKVVGGDAAEVSPAGSARSTHSAVP